MRVHIEYVFKVDDLKSKYRHATIDDFCEKLDKRFKCPSELDLFYIVQKVIYEGLKAMHGPVDSPAQVE